jgi:hypothetical protein
VTKGGMILDRAPLVVCARTACLPVAFVI